ncbi:hypothetical protein FWF89_01420 [Candidatus Saccharibacteria bacterium]|nr:hypothetical protein [Candidatus Saccharibacteria bacterium]
MVSERVSGSNWSSAYEEERAAKRQDRMEEVDFDSYPKLPGENNEAYGERLRGINTKLKDWEQSNVEPESEAEPPDKIRAMIEEKVRLGVYTPEEGEDMIAKMSARMEQKKEDKRYETWQQGNADEMNERLAERGQVGFAEKAAEEIKSKVDEATIREALETGDNGKVLTILANLPKKEGIRDEQDQREYENELRRKTQEANDRYGIVLGEAMKILKTEYANKPPESPEPDDDPGKPGEGEGGKPGEKKEEGEKSREEMIEAVYGDWAWLEKNGDLTQNELKALGDAELKSLYEKWAKEKTETAEKKEREKLTPKELELLEGNVELRDRLLKISREELAEMSAKRRGVFGRKKGGEQEKIYNEAREAYGNDVAAVMKGKMDLFMNKNPEATEAEVNAEFIKLWTAENKQLIDTTKDRMDNGNVIRRIGKFLDKAPMWLRIGIGVGAGALLGAATGGLGLAGAVGAAAGNAALLSRSGSKNSEINRNRDLFDRTMEIEETGADGEDKKTEKVELKKYISENLSKDQKATYDVVAGIITGAHTDAILEDKYRNRKRTVIAVGLAAATAFAAHQISHAIANRGGGTETSGAGTPDGGTPEAGNMLKTPAPTETGGGVQPGGLSETSGGVRFGGGEAASTIPVESAPVFNLDYVAPPGSNIGTAFKTMFGIEPGSTAYNQALDVFEGATGIARGNTHVWANQLINQDGAQAVARAIENGIIKP